MSKKKKHQSGKRKTVNITAPENYVKTRVRTLPISECYISAGWEESKIANILVARSHVNGNKTFGLYLVDLNCLGIKDAAYYFNKSEPEYEQFVKQFTQSNVNRCEYNLVHNIIYGALEFADDYGFKPHKGWEIAKYILEEDDDKIPLTDIEFGHEGKPYYFQGPYESKAKADEIMATLERTAGSGNFYFTLVHEAGGEDDDAENDIDNDIEEDDFDEGDDIEGDDLDEEDNALFSPDDIQRIFSGEQKPTLGQLFILLVSYYRLDRREEKYISTDDLNKNLVVRDNDGSDLLGYFKSISNAQEIFDLIKGLENFSFEKQLKEIDKGIAQYGENPYLYLIKYGVIITEDENIPNDIVLKMEEKYPDFLEFKFTHASALIQSGSWEEAWEFLGGDLTLVKAFPDRNGKFSFEEWLLFNTTMGAYFRAKGELGMALSYASEVAEYFKDSPGVEDLLNILIQQIRDSEEQDENKNSEG